MEINEDILHRFFAGTASEDETDRIGAWLDANPTEHQKVFDEAYKMHVLGIFCSPDITADSQLDASPKSHIRLLNPIFRYVAGIAAALLIGFGVNYAFFSYSTNKWAEQMTTLEVPAGQHIRLSLSDGSVVDLNSGSKIVYPSVFIGKDRKVQISGEAMFDVTPDPKRPFTVETFACNVKVLGTKFNVIADQAANRFSTALMHGSVLITNNMNVGDQIVMKPTDVVSLEHGHLVLSDRYNPDEYLWPDGIISISGVPFDQLMARFEKYYNVRIKTDCPVLPIVKYQRCKVRVSEGIEHALNILQLSTDFTYNYDRDTNTIVIQ